MSIDHHPNDELLLDYSSGALDEGWSLAIATHLALCPDCRQTVRDMEAIGASFLEGLSPTSVSTAISGAVFNQLSDNAAPLAEVDMTRRGIAEVPPTLPEPLRGYIGGDIDCVPWQRLGLGAFQYRIPMEEQGLAVRMLKIPAGRLVPAHSHGGLELTLVLCGSFSDATGRYKRGDIQEVDETLEHQPHVAVGMDCICLAVTDAPLRFSSFAARLVQPFIGI